jgi:predicted porin
MMQSQLAQAASGITCVIGVGFIVRPCDGSTLRAHNNQEEYSMKKSLLAIALIGAVVAPAAALAQTNVTIYGIADVGISRVNNGTSRLTSMDSGILNGSRLGFRGSEDLGGGLSASFQLENGYSVDNGTLRQGGRLWGRQAWVGLNGGFGSVRLGRQDNPIHRALDAIDPFGTGLAGNIENVFNGYDSRSDNVVSYLTPTVGGFFGQLAYGFGEVPGSTSAGRLLAGLAGYKQGPFNIQLAHHNQNIVTAGAAAGNDKTTMLGGVYNFDVAKLHLAYAQNRGDRRGVATTDSHDMMVGVTVPVGPGTVLGSFVRKENRLGLRPSSDQLALGYTYSLSKRTTLYTSYGRIHNDAGGTLGPDGSTVASGATASVFDVGLQHRF